MKISIITPCFNACSSLPKTVESVNKQSFAEVEHLIIDGGSTDGTLSYLKSDAVDSNFWISERDLGIYDAINKGIDRSTGDVIGVLNADDIFYDENVLKVLAKTFSQSPDLEATIGDIVFMKNDRITRHYKASKWKVSDFKRGIMPPHPSFFVRKSLFGKLGGYKIDYKIAADFELLMRYIQVQNIKFEYVPIITTIMAHGGASTKSWWSNFVINREIMKAHRENNLKTNYFHIYSKYPRRMLELIRIG